MVEVVTGFVVDEVAFDLPDDGKLLVVVLEVGAVFCDDVVDDSLITVIELEGSVEVKFSDVVTEEMPDDSMLIVVELGDSFSVELWGDKLLLSIEVVATFLTTVGDGVDVEDASP